MIDAVIVDAVRTASGRGKPGGALSAVHPADLLAVTLMELLRRTGLDAAMVDDVIAGCVGQSGEQTANVARNAVLAAGFPETVPATTVDRQCGSSQQAAHFAAQGVLAGAYDVVIACGVESMSRVPIGSSSQGRDPLGAGVRNRYPAGLVNQGVSAELIAARWKLDRSELDGFAALSHHRAAVAAASGWFDAEIVGVDTCSVDTCSVDTRSVDTRSVDTRGVDTRGVETSDGTTHFVDETVRPGTTAERLQRLDPAFRTDQLAARFPEVGWHITAGNSSPLTDGASAVLIMSAERAAELGLRPRARFHSFAVTGDDPLLMLTGPISATRKILQRSRLDIADLDTYEVNEAFASVPLAWSREFGADPAKLNPRGGAIALGHPLGASGTRLLTTMLGHLEATGGRYGLQTMCEGGGMANATIIERL